MDVFIRGQALLSLDAKIAYVKGWGSHRMVNRIAGIMVEGNAHDRLHGMTRYGGTVAPLRSKRKGKYRGATGPPLAPFGMASRVIANFHATIRRRGVFSSRWEIVAGWRGVVSKKGVPFLPFHDRGSGRLPERPIFGFSPRTMRRIAGAIDEFRDGLKRAR